jgi:hypothetical protein
MINKLQGSSTHAIVSTTVIVIGLMFHELYKSTGIDFWV